MGKVTGITGEPLIGANVLAIGSKQATITNLNGEFTLEVPADGKLQVTYIGYLPQEVSTNGKTQLVIQLKEDSKLMDEVVVVGFGTQKKVNLTGAVTSVNIQETLGDRPITNVTAALQGVVPGLKIEGTTGTPGDNLSYNIRGTTSINGGGPLVLVNNVPMDINMIDPQDIESVSVLKDAASAAIYGARAAFGVILITTKQGKRTWRLSLIIITISRSPRHWNYRKRRIRWSPYWHIRKWDGLMIRMWMVRIYLSGKRIYVIIWIILPNILKGMFSTKTGICS